VADGDAVHDEPTPADEAPTAPDEANAPASGRRFRVPGVSMATKLATALVVVSFGSLAIATLVGLQTGVDLGREIYRERLTSMANVAALDVEASLDSTRSLAEALALSPETASAISAFDSAFTLLDDADEFDVDDASSRLLEAYEDTYLATSTARDIPVEEIVTRSTAALYLQSTYSIGDNDDGDPVVLDDRLAIADAGDGSDWSAAHVLYHPGYGRAVEQLGLVDLYLVEPTSSRVIYSAAKSPDLGTSLDVGPFSGSVLANAVGDVIDDPSAGSVLTDMSLYDAKPGQIVGVLASPVFEGDRLVGVVAVMYDGLGFTDLITADGDWERAGIDESGNVYMIGSDGTTRSDPRGFLDDPSSFLDASQASGLLSTSERAVIEVYGTTVLTQPAVETTVTAAQEGSTEIEERTSMTGVAVIGTVAPLSDADLGWTIVAEAELEIAENAIDDFRNILTVGIAVFAIVISFFAVAWASGLMRPVRAISERLGSGASSDPLSIPESSPTELHHLASSFEEMSATLDHQQVELAIAREERLDLMRSMLPAALAERIVSGDLDELDEVARASVVVVVVLGLAELVRLDATRSDRDLIDRLHEELDVLADEHGIDRVKVVGDAYFGACGHDRPYIDHAPRIVAFAADARDAIRAIAREDGVGLDTAIGVHTGPVTVGMAGGDRLVYDVWGTTVTVAHHLARRSGPGQIMLSDDTHSLLPDEIVQAELDLTDRHVWTVPEPPIDQHPDDGGRSE